MEKEYTCVDEALLEEMKEDASDDLTLDDGFGMAIDLMDDNYVEDGDLIDTLI